MEPLSPVRGQGWRSEIIRRVKKTRACGRAPIRRRRHASSASQPGKISGLVLRMTGFLGKMHVAASAEVAPPTKHAPYRPCTVQPTVPPRALRVSAVSTAQAARNNSRHHAELPLPSPRPYACAPRALPQALPRSQRHTHRNARASVSERTCIIASCVRDVATIPRSCSGSSRWDTKAAANRSTAARGPAGGYSVEVLAATLYGEIVTPAK